jgi:hypothetical protein
MSEDSKALAKLRFVASDKKVHSLDKRYHKLFLSNGLLNPARVRHIFMLAGLLSSGLGKIKEEDRAECLETIRLNIVFLNKYTSS